MAYLENKLAWCVRKAQKEGKEHRGLQEIEPDIEKAKKHIEKAEHNLKAMLYLIKGNFPDWAVNASFYAMYHCILALLVKHGYESRNQECSFTAVEYLIQNKKIRLDVQKLKRIACFDEHKLDEKEIIKLREAFQYGTETIMDDAEIKNLVRETQEFIDIVKEELKE